MTVTMSRQSAALQRDRGATQGAGMTLWEVTIAEALQSIGYATGLFGKWHLGAQPYSQPQHKGFDEYYGIPPADTWDAFGMIRQGRSG